MVKNAARPASEIDGNRPGEMVILEQVGRLQVFVVQGAVPLNELERHLVVKVSPWRRTF